uniref:Jumonji domain containing 8 n=2 Tax=Passeriformes TaxID=9126 RepID=A0A674HDT4_TAEGU
MQRPLGWAPDPLRPGAGPAVSPVSPVSPCSCPLVPHLKPGRGAGFHCPFKCGPYRDPYRRAQPMTVSIRFAVHAGSCSSRCLRCRPPWRRRGCCRRCCCCWAGSGPAPAPTRRAAAGEGRGLAPGPLPVPVLVPVPSGVSRCRLAGTVPEEPRCTVERADASLTYPLFLQRFAFSRPLILGGVTDNSAFRALCTREKLLAAFGPFPVRLSTANTYSYRKGERGAVPGCGGPAPPFPPPLPRSPSVPAVDVPFQEYVEQLLKPQDPARLGSDTLYFFGDNNFTEWGPLFQHYVPPPFRIPGTSPAYSFGIAGSGSGVPFHWHGPGFSEVIFGRKRWFLYPPDQTPHFHPNETTLAWLQHTYPTLPPAQRPLECTLRPGEVLYFPDRWWHATLNLDTSVFISTFLG